VEAAFDVAVRPRPVRGDDAAALQTALEALHRGLALPITGDGGLAELAARVGADATAEQLQVAASELGLVDGKLSVHRLPRGGDGSWGAHTRESLRAVLAAQRPTHYGAVVVAPDHARVVYGRRPAELAAPRRVEVGEPIALRGRLPAVARSPVVEVVDPGGAFRALPAGPGPDFEVQLETPRQGTYRVRVRDAAARVWAQLAVHAGQPSQPAGDDVGARTPARLEIYQRLQARARARGRAVLRVAPELEEAASGEAKLAGQLVLRGRVRGAGLEELIGALERDPGCRAALDHPDVTHVGVHLARRAGGFELSLVTARLPSASAPELSAARVLEAINRNRRARGSAPLVPNARLGEVARRTAAARLRGELADEDAMVAAANAELERFSLAYRRVAALVARVGDPTEASALEPALDAGASVIGVGIARLGTASRAEGKPFVVVLALGWSR
jgi:hypothetical protein